MLALLTDPATASGLTLADVPEPTAASDQAIVDVEATSLNRGEVRAIPTSNAGTVLGWDVAGTVRTAAADGTGPAAGSRVAGVLLGGAWAQRVAIRTAHLAEVPDGVTITQAAALPLAGLSALGALRVGGNLLGKRVLITGAAGGVGRLAVQLAVQAGAHVTGVAASAERGRELAKLGVAVITSLDVGGEEFDVILESAGGSSLGAALTRVGPRGTVVAFGNSSDEPTGFDVNDLYLRAPGARLEGFVIFDHLARGLLTGDDLRALLALVADGRLDPGVSVETGWHDVDDAIARLLSRQVSGKAVVHFDR
jgi:NADPH:quinone reductase